MQEIQNIVTFLRNCYQSDQRESNIWDIFHHKLEQQLFFEGEERLLTAEIPHQFIVKEKAETYLATSKLYRKEKELYYFSFFITGQLGNNIEETESAKQICAPLLYYPAEIFQEGRTIFSVWISANKILITL